jgi:hypothetical protein
MEIIKEIPFDDLFGTIDQTVGCPDASSGDGIMRTNEQMKEFADQCGCTYREAKDNELFIDLDTEHAYRLYKMVLPLLAKHFPFKDQKITPSKQGLPHRHVVITLSQDYSVITRIGLQASLGSDPLRELLSLRRVENGEENVVVFFEKI